MIVLDTHVLVSDALDPSRLSRAARGATAEAQAADELACSDLSLWEIAMLLARGRLQVDAEHAAFLEGLIQARAIRVLAITPAIAVLAQSEVFSHRDPAERIVAATALAHRARLVSADQRLRKVKDLRVVW